MKYVFLSIIIFLGLFFNLFLYCAAKIANKADKRNIK